MRYGIFFGLGTGLEKFPGYNDTKRLPSIFYRRAGGWQRRRGNRRPATKSREQGRGS